MGKQYTKVTNDQRRELIKLIHELGHSISKAAEITGVYYPTAKAINKVYKKEKRVQKRNFRYRAKKEDDEIGIVRNKIPVERLETRTFTNEDKLRLTCGIKLKSKSKCLHKSMDRGFKGT
jgi:transposase